MSEQFRSITEARKDLPKLSQTVQSGGDRFVITNQGKPQAVLLGYGEYKGLLAAAELLRHPKELADLEEGLAQTQKLGFEELKENLRRRKAAQDQPAAVAIARRATQAAPAASINEKLEEIKGDVNRILDRLGAGEIVLVAGEGGSGRARGHQPRSRPNLPAVLQEAREGKPIRFEVTKVSSPGRRRGGTLPARAEAEAER